jgi:hypothetical protein
MNEMDDSKTLAEFNSNYKSYLENKLLLNILYDSFTNQESLCVNDLVGNNELNQQIQDNFWKSFLNQQDDQSVSNDEFKNDPLPHEAKKLILNKLETNLEAYFKDINNYLKFAKIEDSNDLEETQEDEISMSTNKIFHKSLSTTNFNTDSTVSKLKSLIESTKTDKFKIDKISKDIDIKLQHCFNKSVEIANLLNKIINEFKIEFYSNYNKIELEHELAACDSLFKKMDQVQSSMINDLYNPERAACLKMIKSQIELETMKSKDTINKINTTLDLYRSLGEEFENILSTYLDLKAQYDRKMYTIQKLKGEEIIS